MESNWLFLYLAGSTLLVINSLKPATALDFNLADFSDVSSLTLNGNAVQNGNRLRLASASTFEVGTAFANTPVTIDADTSFSTNFQFDISADTGGDGITFIVQNDPSALNALGGFGNQIAYGGIANSIAVEFDTIDNGVPFNDPDANHVGINTNGSAASISAVTSSLPLVGGGALSAWIDYDGTTNQLDVFLSDTTTKPGSALLTDTVDLFGSVGSQGYVGFGSGTGTLADDHDIINWQFSSDPTPVPFGTAPNIGIGILAGIWGISRLRKTIKASKSVNWTLDKK